MKITVRPLTGECYDVEVPNTATLLDLKKEVLEKDSSLLLHLQRLVKPGRGILEDGDKLLECGISEGATLNLVILTPYNIHLQDISGKMHTIEVLETYTVTALRVQVEKVVGHSMSEYQLHHQGKPLLERKQQKEMLLRDYTIIAESTVVMTEMGFDLDVTNPMIDVCFLVDCTGSMDKHITVVKSNITQLRDQLVKEYNGCDFLFSFVRYTDFDVPAFKMTSCLQFTGDPSTFQNFVSQIEAEGGGDGPEDIMGGFKVAFNDLSWRSDSCKILIHIADAPCHGTHYHGSLRDTYPSGDPAGITHESMMAHVVRLNILYWFGYINKWYTDKMIGIFDESLKEQSQRRLIIRQFDAMKCHEVGDAVQRSVIAGVYSKAALEPPAEVQVDTDYPDWNSPFIVEQAAKITPPGKKIIFNLDADFELEKPSVDFCFKIAPNPFFKGSNCFVYHASDLVNFRMIVLKRFKQPGLNKLEPYMKKLKVYTISTFYAHKFNDDDVKPQSKCSINFTQSDIIQSDGSVYYMLEPLLEETVETFNSKDGDVTNCPQSDVLQAFSHYTWVKSGETLLVCDLQGYKLPRRDKIVLTDPAIHSNGTGGKYGATDTGNEGVEKFFSTHTCSAICEQMNLARQTV